MHALVLFRRKTRLLLELSGNDCGGASHPLPRARSIYKGIDTASANKTSEGTAIFQGADAPVQEKFEKKADFLLDFMKKRDTL